jgi:hypothetical protein
MHTISQLHISKIIQTLNYYFFVVKFKKYSIFDR